jgi:hypothetical protein
MMRTLTLAALLGGCCAQRVAIVLGGPHRGSSATAAELRRAVVAPLVQDGMEVHLWAAGFVGARGKENHEDAWRRWLAEATDGTNASAHFVSLPSDEDLLTTYPLQEHYLASCADSQYHRKYLHTTMAWEAAQADGAAYDYVIKTRDDLAFGAGQTVKPCWLREVDDNVVLAANKEHHQGGYWFEVGGWLYSSAVPSSDTSAFKSWQNPSMIMDQFWLGKARAVGALVNMVTAPPNLRAGDGRSCRDGSPLWTALGRDYPGGPESVLADYLWRKGLSFYPVSLSLYKLVNDDAWDETHEGLREPPSFRGAPCYLCFECFR